MSVQLTLEEQKARRAEYKRRYRERHPERIQAAEKARSERRNELRRERRKSTRAEDAEATRLWRQNNPEKYRMMKERDRTPDPVTGLTPNQVEYRKDQETYRSRAKARREQIKADPIAKALELERMRLWRSQNKDLISGYQRRYFQRHPESAKAQTARRRRLIRENGGKISVVDIRRIFVSQEGRCHWCGKELAADYHVDHIIPLSKGGRHTPANACCSCPKCNQVKNAKMPWEFCGRLF